MADIFIDPEAMNLHEAIRHSIDNYFRNIGSENPTNLYEILLDEIELPFLSSVMKYTRGNQSKAAKMLGLSRGTLRKKLKRHGMLTNNTRDLETSEVDSV